MLSEVYLLAALVFIGFGAVIWLLNRKISQLQELQKQQDPTLTEWLKSMQSSIEGQSKTLNQVIADTNQNLNQALATTNKNLASSLQSSTKAMNERLDNAAKYISEVAKEVGQMSEIGRSMKDLQEFLKSPKLRGNIGEEVLKDLITQMFPKHSFHLQYSFKSGEKVDAAIQTAAGILPIDSKFPMENFQKMSRAKDKQEQDQFRRVFINDVRKHIRDIAKKYILPEEGTMDLALMYIPSEPVYYEIVNDSELTDYARKVRVYPVSPTTLYAHLQMILLSFEGQKIESRSKQVFQLLRAIQKDYEKTENTLQVLGRHINNAYNQFANTLQGFSLLGQKISQTQALSEPEQETKELEA
jgi:DNA recombination protein RmuC